MSKLNKYGFRTDDGNPGSCVYHKGVSRSPFFHSTNLLIYYTAVEYIFVKKNISVLSCPNINFPLFSILLLFIDFSAFFAADTNYNTSRIIT